MRSRNGSDGGHRGPSGPRELGSGHNRAERWRGSRRAVAPSLRCSMPRLTSWRLPMTSQTLSYRCEPSSSRIGPDLRQFKSLPSLARWRAPLPLRGAAGAGAAGLRWRWRACAGSLGNFDPPRPGFTRLLGRCERSVAVSYRGGGRRSPWRPGSSTAATTLTRRPECCADLCFYRGIAREGCVPAVGAKKHGSART